ncbi:MAG: hypothetical protein HW412_2388 [Bacteroidetes bacterium]|nr:hypothetical protein [Bacteroidota bacterium]
MHRQYQSALRHQIALIAILIAMTLSMAILACKDDNPTGEDGSPSNVIFPNSNVSYSQHVQVLFNQACAFSGCHSGSEPSDRIRLDSYENLMFGVSGIHVVVPGSPETSTLVSRIQGLPPRMPPSGNLLNLNQITGIRVWIGEGARRN